MILKNKNILLTGAGKGIGKACFYDLIKEGAFVLALVKSKKDYQFLKNTPNSKIFLGDVRNKNLINKIFKYASTKKKYITGLVNNAGIRQRKNFINLNSKEIKEVFEVNFFSIFFIMQNFSKHVLKYKLKGSIVNVGSIVGQAGFSELTGYASTKMALTGLTKSFAIEMAKRKIRANIISPGFTKTSYYNEFKKKKSLYKWTLSKIPMNRWAESFEISNLIIFLLSNKSEFITGENINIDGGWST